MADVPLVRVGFDGNRDADHQTLVIRTVDGTVRVIDLDAAVQGLRTMGERLRGFLAKISANANKMTRAYGDLAARVARARVDQANNPVRIAGLEARYWVRAGLDPRYRDPAGLEQLVDDILNVTDPDLRYVRPDNLRTIAVAAARGWLESYVPSAAAALRRGPIRGAHDSPAN